MRITPCAHAMPRSGCRRPCGATRTSCAARRASRCRSASASTPARSWCARSAAISAWTTPPWARPRTWRPAWSSSRRPAASGSPPRRCTWPRASSRSPRSARCRSRGSPSRSRCSSWWGPAPPAPASRPRRGGGSRASSAGPRSWSSSATPSTGRARGTARWSPWSGSRAWASRVSSGSSPTPIACTAGSSCSPPRSPTARPPPTCP